MDDNNPKSILYMIGGLKRGISSLLSSQSTRGQQPMAIPILHEIENVSTKIKYDNEEGKWQKDALDQPHTML